jgi:hypothetical protein
MAPNRFGVDSTHESTDLQSSYVYPFYGTSIGGEPAITTLTFARLVFTANQGNIANDGNDVVSGVDFPNRSNLIGKVGSDANDPSPAPADLPSAGAFSIAEIPRPPPRRPHSSGPTRESCCRLSNLSGCRLRTLRCG